MTRSTVAGSARFRQRKLSTRQALQILREDEVDQVDDETQRNITKVDTGVEKGEEIVSSICLVIRLATAKIVGALPFWESRLIFGHIGTPPASCVISISSRRCRWEGCSDIYSHPRCYPELDRL